ncbi:MAG: hypothetical protein JWR16_3201 [Nevskia sp.]|nr:hypothetical protein [Nevskia sp.]
MIPSALRQLYQIPDGVVYLNTASMGPRLRAVTAAGQRAVERYAAPWTIGDAAWFTEPEVLRRSVAALIDVSADALALIPSASYGIAIAAKNLRLAAHSNIVLLEEQFPSNVYAWQRLAAQTPASIRRAARGGKQTLTESVLSCIDARTSLVAIPNCHWSDGEWIDLVAVATAAHAVGAALVIDASQSLGALPLDIAAIQPDFVVAVGYKWLLGPYGLGYLYASPHWQREGVPLEESWMTRAGSDNFARLVDYVDDYRPGARRFDFGEFSQFISVPMAQAAIAQLAEWRVAAIHQHLRAITARIRDVALGLGYTTQAAAESAGHFLGLRRADGEMSKLAQQLRAAGIHLSIRGDCLRIAPHLHTTDADVDRLLNVLAG